MADSTRGKAPEAETRRLGRRQLIQALGVGGAAAVASRWTKPVVDMVVVPLHAQASAATGSLYAISGAAGAPSTLYILDPATGAVVSTVGATGFSHVTAIDFHPITGVLYGVTSEGEGAGTSQLITINLLTGAGTAIGPTGLGSVPDISFDSTGTLYAWTENGDDLATIDTGTGAGTVIGSPIGTARTGLAFDSGGTLYLKDQDDLDVISTADGTLITMVSISVPSLDNALAFNGGGTLYTLERTVSGMSLYTLQTATGTASLVGSNALADISAIAFNPFIV